MNTEFGTDHGLIHEAVVTGRKVGADKEFWSALAHSEELFAKVISFVVKALKVVFTISLDIDRNMDGWKCVEPVEVVEGEFEPELQEFLREGESYVGGEEMVKRAKDRTGLRHAEAMLREQDKIPADYRKYVLVFPEVWRDPCSDRGVFCLSWGGGRWVLGYDWLSDGFGSSYRLVRPRKYQK